MKTLKIITYILAIIAGFFIGATTCKGQSFTAHKTAPYALHQGTMNKNGGET